MKSDFDRTEVKPSAEAPRVERPTEDVSEPDSSKSRKVMVWLLRLVVLAGFLAFAYYFSWWFEVGALRSPLMVLIFICAVFYGGMQMAGNWILYLFAHRSQPLKEAPPEGMTVDVFVTAYQEPFEMVERALEAACKMRGKHKTWLLDDGDDPALEKLAERLGAGYLTRPDHHHAKAGNVNAALPKTQGDVIVIFDIDHNPKPDFLERSLGYFSDPKIGFVQVMLTFGNGPESWVAQAAIETSLEFYNPTSFGAHGIGGATLMGSNALIRRSALEQIGGYQPGLAEDLATSIALHAAGWKSAYVAEPLAPGLAPPSFVAWFTQQLKWARGVFELLITTFPRLFPRLSWGQRLSYAVRMTKYWIGPVVGVHLFATIGILIFAGPEVRGLFHDYLIHIAPLALADVVIRHLAFRLYRHKQVENASLARAVTLVYATWPIYTLAWAMALLRVPLKFHPTPKDSKGRLHPAWLMPQFVALGLVVAGGVYTVAFANHPVSLLLLFAGAQALLQLLFLAQWLRGVSKRERKPAVPVPGKPTAVLEVDFHQIPNAIEGLGNSEQAFCLVRLGGRPVGQVVVPVQNGALQGEALRKEILAAAEWPFWERWLQEYLAWEPIPANGNGLSATVAVCTRDRPDDLRCCLQALSQMPDQGQEILVVDSCSATSATREVVAEFPGVRYVREDYPGLNRARNRAFLEARTQVLAFVDDDAAPDRGWLQALLKNFQDPRVLCVTGLTMPMELATEAQQWFECYSGFGRGFERQVFDKNGIHPLAAGRAGAGVNMAFRREVWNLIGPFDEALDAGTPTRSGGDTEMFCRILAEGYQIVYDPSALSWHRHRRDWEQLRQTLYGYGTGVYAFWTRKLLVDGEWDVFPLAVNWALWYQLPALAKSLLRRPDSIPVQLLLAELSGCVAGPITYFKSRKLLTQKKRNGYVPYGPQLASQRHYSHS